MLRNAILLFSGTAFVLALAASLLLHAFWPPTLLFGLCFAGTVFERARYRQLDAVPPPGPDWQSTEERFVDPESGRLVTVWFQASTGARRYVAADRRARESQAEPLLVDRR